MNKKASHFSVALLFAIIAAMVVMMLLSTGSARADYVNVISSNTNGAMPNDDKVAIGNRVWSDENNSRKLDTDAGVLEKGINNIPVKLYRDSNGNGKLDPTTDTLVATTTTANIANGSSNRGYYMFTDVTPSTAGQPNTYYIVAISIQDLKDKGYLWSSNGGNHNPDIGDEDEDDGDDGTVSGDYVTSQALAATLHGQTDTSDAGDPSGYDDDSSYMTVDFGFIHEDTMREYDGPPLAVTLQNIHANDITSTWIIGMLTLILVFIVAAFSWRQRQTH